MTKRKSKQAGQYDSVNISSEKKAKKSAEIEPDEDLKKKPLWSISLIDMDGAFGWHTVDLDTFNYIKNKLSNFETMTWGQIFIASKKQNHYASVESLSSIAQNRLKELELYYDELHSLRLDGVKRIWGIFEDGYFRILWWDPKHQVYPSKLKNT